MLNNIKRSDQKLENATYSLHEFIEENQYYITVMVGWWSHSGFRILCI